MDAPGSSSPGSPRSRTVVRPSSPFPSCCSRARANGREGTVSAYERSTRRVGGANANATLIYMKHRDSTRARSSCFWSVCKSLIQLAPTFSAISWPVLCLCVNVGELQEAVIAATDPSGACHACFSIHDERNGRPSRVFDESPVKDGEHKRHLCLLCMRCCLAFSFSLEYCRIPVWSKTGRPCSPSPAKP